MMIAMHLCGKSKGKRRTFTFSVLCFLLSSLPFLLRITTRVLPENFTFVSVPLPSFGRFTTSKSSVGLKEKFYVISLHKTKNSAQKGNSQRLRSFKEKFSTLCFGRECPDLKVIDGHVDQRRGAGLLAGFIDVLTDAIDEEVDRMYIFEDDIDFYNDVLFSAAFRAEMWAKLPRPAFVLVFAAHHVAQHQTVHSSMLSFAALNESLGSYGWAVSRENFVALRHFWKNELRGPSRYFSPDLDISRSIMSVDGVPSYILRYPPLLFHKSNTFSNTWGIRRRHVSDRPPIHIVTTGRDLKRSSLESLWSLANNYGLDITHEFLYSDSASPLSLYEESIGYLKAVFTTPFALIISSECGACFQHKNLLHLIYLSYSDPYALHMARVDQTSLHGRSVACEGISMIVLATLALESVEDYPLFCTAE